MIDYTRFRTSELHLGKFPAPLEFQSWKVSFKTEGCSKSADPQLTMHWTKEVEVAKSIDELMTSRTITERHDLPDYDMFDSMIASAISNMLRKRRSPARSQRNVVQKNQLHC